jgi:hypothetical protein
MTWVIPIFRIVHHTGEVVRGGTVGTEDHEILEFPILEFHPAGDEVLHHRYAFLRHAEPNRTVRLVSRTAPKELLRIALMDGKAIGLAIKLVPIQS